MKKIFCNLFIFAITVVMSFVIVFAANSITRNTQTASAVEHKILFSENNAPIFYGATKITIDKNVQKISA